MENKQETGKKPEVEFKNVETIGDSIDALVRYFTGHTCSRFILRMAAERVEENEKKMKEFKEQLLNQKEVV